MWIQSICVLVLGCAEERYEKWLLKVYRVSVWPDLEHLELNSDGVLHYKCISYYRPTYFKIIKMANFVLYAIYYNCCLVTNSCTQGGIEPSSPAWQVDLLPLSHLKAHVTVIEKNKYNIILVSVVPSYFLFLPVSIGLTDHREKHLKNRQ